jgi:uncharacterized membrane protein
MSAPAVGDAPSAEPSGICRLLMRWVLAALYVAAGIAHLAAPEQLMAITPSWVPLAPQVIFITGLFELVASGALVTRPWRRFAGITMAVYALCVWPANFKHAFEGIDLHYVSSSWLYHGPRLALQPVIIWWALYCAGVTDWPWRRVPGAGSSDAGPPANSYC